MQTYSPKSVVMPVFVMALNLLCINGNAQAEKPSAQFKPTPSKSKKTQMSAPETPQELWSRVLGLLKKNHGYVAKEDVENAIGLKFTKNQKDGDDPKTPLGADYLHTVETVVPKLGKLNVGLLVHRNRSDLTITWGPELGEPKGCLLWGTVVSDLEPLGWKAFKRAAGVMPGAGEFYRVEQLSDSRWSDGPTRENLNNGMSKINFWAPNHFTPCVNAVLTTVWNPNFAFK